MAKGEYEETLSTLNELTPTTGESPIILNLLGLCAINDQNFEEAEHLLSKCMEKVDGDTQLRACTLVNIIAMKRSKGENFSDYENALRELQPQHNYFRIMQESESLFDSLLA